MKKTYIIPNTLVVKLHQADGILTTLSGGDTGLRSGGTTTQGNVYYSDTKQSSDYNVWNDDWNK